MAGAVGLRGPGASPIKSVEVAAGALPEAMPWQKPGLSRVNRVIAFLEALPVTSGKLAGQKFKVRPWQKKYLKAVYGKSGVRTAVLSMGRKNGKTALAAPLALCHLAGPEAEERGEVYSAANDRFQSGRTFSEMAAIVERVPYLKDRISIRRHSKEMEYIGGTGSIFAALSADVATKHGLSPSFCVYDEFGQATSRDLFDALDTAMGARVRPLMMVISTQAADDKMPMSQLVDYGLQVNAGEIKDPTFHLTLFTAPDDLDPWSKKAWKLANPALGDFRSLEDVQRLASQAQRMSAKESAFRNLILNQRCAAESRFINQAEWTACGEATDVSKLKGRPCYAALDLGATRDLTALVMVFQAEDGSFDAMPVFWLPGDGLRERSDRDRVPYVQWHTEGHLRTVPGATFNPAFAARAVAELHGQFGIRAIAYDRWRIEEFKRYLSEEGIDDIELIPHGQGYRDMAPAIDMLERVIAERRLRHGNHPVLKMCAGNAVVITDPAGNRKLDKDKSTQRIDGLVALAMAINIASRHVETPDWQPMCEII